MRVKKIWVVVNSNQEPIWFGTFQDAKDRAAKLAMEHPGDEYIVLESVGSVKVADTAWLAHND
tara:strand:- start:85 stop:273 length:189 start_codon:yes stop_codon:yes gene_type:complete